MTVPEDFSRILRFEGEPVAQTNPGSDEQALKPAAALKALDLLAGTDVTILGGDGLSESLGKLEYTYEKGHCERLLGESAPAFANRSRSVARQFVDKLEVVSKVYEVREGIYSEHTIFCTCTFCLGGVESLECETFHS